jgi:hypothetical protein
MTEVEIVFTNGVQIRGQSPWDESEVEFLKRCVEPAIREFCAREEQTND